MNPGTPDGLAAAVIATAALALAIATLYRYAVRPIARTIATIAQIGGDWYGREGDPGHPRIPGVMERLTSIESELRPNGGGSLKDQAGRIETDLAEVRQDVAALMDGQAEARNAAEKAADLAAEVHDEFHGYVEEGHLREATYLASLHEIGIDIEPQPRRDPHARTRAEDLED